LLVEVIRPLIAYGVQVHVVRRRFANQHMRTMLSDIALEVY
jgi:hypothetical protein